MPKQKETDDSVKEAIWCVIRNDRTFVAAMLGSNEYRKKMKKKCCQEAFVQGAATSMSLAIKLKVEEILNVEVDAVQVLHEVILAAQEGRIII